MTAVVQVCRRCGRDLAADADPRARYCDPMVRQCRAKAKDERRAKRVPHKAKAGDTRKVRGGLLVRAPGHPLDTGNGWVSVRRAAMFDALEGTDPRCVTCGRHLDWAAGGRDDARVCVVKPSTEPTAELVLCRSCLTGVGVAGAALGAYLHPLAWGSATDARGGDGDNRPPLFQDGAAAPGGSADMNLTHHIVSLAEVWDGSEGDALRFAAAATLLALNARRVRHGCMG